MIASWSKTIQSVAHASFFCLPNDLRVRFIPMTTQPGRLRMQEAVFSDVTRPGPKGASSQTRNSPAGSCVSIVLQASHQRVAGVENPCKRSRRICERSAKFSHCWRRQRCAAAGVPTLSGKNRSRKCPENV